MRKRLGRLGIGLLQWKILSDKEVFFRHCLQNAFVNSIGPGRLVGYSKIVQTPFKEGHCRVKAIGHRSKADC